MIFAHLAIIAIHRVQQQAATISVPRQKAQTKVMHHPRYSVCKSKPDSERLTCFGILGHQHPVPT